MTDRTTQPSALPAEFAERASDPVDAWAWQRARLRYELPRRNSMENASSEQVEEITAEPADDLLSRLDVLRELDRRIAFWSGKLNVSSAWFQSDIVKIATLKQLRAFVAEMERT